MFFFGSGTSILPYLLYLVLIWGFFLLNGILDTTLKKEIRHRNSEVYEAESTSSFLKHNCYVCRKHQKIYHPLVKNFILFDKDLSQRLTRQRSYLPLKTCSYVKDFSFGFLQRGPPGSNFTHPV